MYLLVGENLFFDKLHADLGKAILSINACKSFEIGGFEGTSMLSSNTMISL
ncbi:MAG: chorismate synthase [Saprospiraceae bacterium]